MSELEMCLDLVCLHLCEQSSSFRLQGLLPGFFARRQIEFFEDDFWVNQTSKIDFPKRFPVIQVDSMCQAAIFCRGWAWSENSESLQV